MSLRTTYLIEDVLDWKLKEGQTLREALVDEAKKELRVSASEGTIDIRVDGTDFVAIFTEE